MTIKFLGLARSSNPDKKFMARFEVDGRERITHFGARGMQDYTTHNRAVREERKRAYDARHQTSENWSDPTSAGALAKYILWNKTTISASLADYKRRFNL